jgi:tripartite-type tricarboxylate transporter receptor subunit TctC
VAARDQSLEKAVMRGLLRIFALGCAALLARPADAEIYPTRPITIFVGFAAGSGIDVITRLIAHRLEAALKQSVLIENKIGANSAIAAVHVARAAPDGYTLLAGGSTTHAANPNLFKRISYDPARDFEPVTLTGGFVYMLVAHPQVPATSAADLIDFARANPARLSYATSNSSGLISALTFVRWAGIDMNHVPYRTAPPAINDVLGGRVSLMFADITTALPHVRAGTLRGLAVMASKRYAGLPNLPCLEELGLPGFDGPSWGGIFAPANTPKDIITRLNIAIREIIDDPATKAQFADLGFEAFSSTPLELSKLAESDRIRWSQMIKDAHIEPQ